MLGYDSQFFEGNSTLDNTTTIATMKRFEKKDLDILRFTLLRKYRSVVVLRNLVPVLENVFSLLSRVLVDRDIESVWRLNVLGGKIQYLPPCLQSE